MAFSNLVLKVRQAHFNCVPLIKALRKTLPASKGENTDPIFDGKNDQKKKKKIVNTFLNHYTSSERAL